MVEMTASEMSRNFSAALDTVEAGESIVVTRSGRRVAVVSPATTPNGTALLDTLRRWHRHPALDNRFAAQVAEAGEAASAELDTDAWHA